MQRFLREPTATSFTFGANACAVRDAAPVRTEHHAAIRIWCEHLFMSSAPRRPLGPSLGEPARPLMQCAPSASMRELSVRTRRVPVARLF